MENCRKCRAKMLRVGIELPTGESAIVAVFECPACHSREQRVIGSKPSLGKKDFLE